MIETKRALFGLFRSRSRAGKEDEEEKTREKTPKSNTPKDSPPRLRKKVRQRPGTSPPETRRRVRRHGRSDGSQLDNENVDRDEHPEPRWPPLGFTYEDDLLKEQALELIASGATIYKGCQVSIPHASEKYYALYSLCEGSKHHKSDCAPFYSKSFRPITFRLLGSGVASTPWDTLEQPSRAFCYGVLPGTVTLNYWAGLSGKLKPEIDLVDPHVLPRDISLSGIIERMVFLQDGLEEDNKELMYRNLYTKLLKDPDKHQNPHKAMERQITDLIVVLSGSHWIDFSKPENQVVAKFFLDPDYIAPERYKAFLHQLLLGMELNARIQSRDHADWAKEQLIQQLPPRIAWMVAVARRWQECIKVEKAKKGQIRLALRCKKTQVKGIRKFIRRMSWPNLREVDSILKETDPSSIPIEELSSDSMSYFSGVILPGNTLPFLLINALIDCDAKASPHLGALSHMYPNCGFQYRATTYWNSACIVGKVLAPTCKELGGWIGPARSTLDLAPTQVARIRQRHSKQSMTPKEVNSMNVRSEPLGPPATKYPVEDYQLVIPDFESPDIVRIEKLELVEASPLISGEPASRTPQFFDATIRFAIDGESWTFKLVYDVSFVCAYPCTRGPHSLFIDYEYESVKIDELLTIQNWGGIGGSLDPDTVPSSQDKRKDNDIEKVLVIEAFGLPDTEVLARAYCSHWGLGAVVANTNRTCMACAVREAYAACLNVVILVQEGADADLDSP